MTTDQSRRPGDGGLRVALGAGALPMPGFVRVDIDPGVHPDRVMDIRNLDFAPGSVSVLYASHVVEHLRPEPGDRWTFLVQLFSRWRSLLSPDGRLFLAVPDLAALGNLLAANEHVDMHKMITDALFGGGRTEFDFHYSGFTQPLLTSLLLSAGFASVEKFAPFFADETRHTILGADISLNLVAHNSASPVSAPIPAPAPSEEATELLELRKAADERLALIHKLTKDCLDKERVIQELARTCGEREKSLQELRARLRGRR